MKHRPIYAQDRFFQENGALKAAEDALDLSIVFFGGSLTEGGNAWRDAVTDYFRQKFGGTVTARNAGLGGTGTAAGAARFQNDVGRFAPDVVFVDFSLNDVGEFPDLVPQKHYKYTENIIRQAMALPKIPVLIFIHTPFPVLEDDIVNINLQKSNALKEEVARHYGISTINLYPFFQKYFQEDLAFGKISGDFFSWVAANGYHLAPNGVTYDVHPNQDGYALYGRAILESFETYGIAHYLTRLTQKEIFCKEEAKQATASYCLVPATSDRISYSEGWKKYAPYAADYTAHNEENTYIGVVGSKVDGEYRPTGSRHTYYLQDGIAEAYQQNGASFTFTTTADAIAFFYNAAKAFASATLYVNGVVQQKFQLRNQYQPQYFMCDPIPLQGETEEKKIKIVVDDATETAFDFRFAYLVELFHQK